MSILDSIRLLYCLNESGVNRAHDLLTELVADPQYQRVTLEQLFEETDNITQEAESEYQKERKEAKQQELDTKQRFKEELMMIDRCCIPWLDNKDILKAIDVVNSEAFWKVRESFTWGYIQGIRAERARRKKVSQ